MKKKLKLWLALMVVLIVSFALKSNIRIGSAATTVKDFYFSDPNGKTVNDGGMMDMTTMTKEVYVTTIDGMNTSDIVEWSSSHDNIVSVATTGPNTAKLTRNGPGYARITAKITRGNVYYSISMLVKVEVEIKYRPDDISPRYTPLVQIAQNEQKAIVLDYCPDSSYQMPTGYTNTAEIILQYTLNPEVVNNQLLTWTSSDETVVSVDHSGKITATGAGSAYIHITTNTMAGADMDEIKVLVIVNPMVNTNIYGVEGQDEWVHKGVVTGSSNFYIQSNAIKATNLDWVVTDVNGNVLPSNSDVLNYKAYSTSGAFEISKAKVGVYYVKAFAKGLNSENTGVKYVDLTVVVPFSPPKSITMNVSDTYDLIGNLNMASNFISIKSEYENIVAVDEKKGILIAKATGSSIVSLRYKKYENGQLVDTETKITVNVIDALALNLSDATIYVGGTVKLDATVTDIMAQLTWSSSKPSVATVSGGIVTGVSAGECKITVSTTINGVYKSASCNILIVQAPTNITIDPPEVSLHIGEYKTLIATITPASLNNVELKWISSNEKVVQVTENGKKYATIKAISSGTAVITAINQQNVVVGFCNVTVKQPVTSITLSETNVTVSLAEGSFTLKASVLPTTATNQKLKYTSSNSSIVRVDDTGKVTLVSAGTASIIVTSEDVPSISAICNVTVTTPVTGVTLDSTGLSMVVGETKKLTYTIIPTTATNKDVTWTSSDNSVCTVSATGSVTAVKAGNAIITITTKDGKYTKSCTVIVSQYASAIKLDVTDLTLNVGETYSVVVTTTPSSSSETFTWETSNANVATVSATGKITAKSEGTAIIIVKSNKGLTAFCNVKVQQQASGIELNYDKKTVATTNIFTLKATVLPVNASNQKVTFVSSNPSVATVSSDGSVKGLKGGTAIITVTSVEGEYKATCIVTVKELVTSITLTNSYKLGKGKTYQFVPTVKTNSATTTKLQWSSSNTKVAEVDKNGNVKAVSYGKATITVKATDGSGAKASCVIQVIRPVTSVSLDKAVLSVIEGQSKKLIATVKPTNATYKSVTWTSSNENIAVVDSKGKVTGISEGSVTIKATAKDGTKKSAKSIVTVRKKVTSTSITIANQSLVMVKGESKTVQTVMSPANTTDGYKWSSDNNVVATVDKSSGRIVAKANGTATITVMTDSGKTAHITVNVVGLSRSTLTLGQYNKHVLRVDGDTSNVTWDVENPNIATVRNGEVTARAIGTTNIIATVNGRRLYCKLKVTKLD